jgi:hypothetical protein
MAIAAVSHSKKRMPKSYLKRHGMQRLAGAERSIKGLCLIRHCHLLARFLPLLYGLKATCSDFPPPRASVRWMQVSCSNGAAAASTTVEMVCVLVCLVTGCSVSHTRRLATAVPSSGCKKADGLLLLRLPTICCHHIS